MGKKTIYGWALSNHSLNGFLLKKKYSRKTRSSLSGKRRGRIKKLHIKPKIDPKLKPIFSKIGIPEPEPFHPDPFQLEALSLINDYDVLVSAPTGSGKTWIASQAIESYLSKGLKVWYASPLKALSNSIYQDFCGEFGDDRCGILTGDRKENLNAPVIVGTTEILRNQLYDTMHEGINIKTDLVILDEAHYLSDPDRGVVWEETLIYLPPRVRLLLLSATISNAQEICGWLKKIRGTPNKVVKATERPVPLEMLFLFPDGLIAPLGTAKGLNPEIKKFLTAGRGMRRGRIEKINFGNILACLRKFNLLPAIFFLKSRADCDRAIQTCSPINRSSEVGKQLKKTVDAYLKDYPHIEGHRQLAPLLESRVASHHAGQLPYWKVLIEKIMNKGYLEAIFSTSTVAAGVNFPARTVILVQSDRYNGHDFVNLSATDLHQMTGRAGRRGKDHIGFVLIIPGIHQNPQLIHNLKDSPPEPILSRIHINFSMTLNLLLSYTPPEIKDLLDRSFSRFQEKNFGSHLKARWEDMLLNFKQALPKAVCETSDPYKVMDYIQRRAELQKDVKVETRAEGYEKLVRAYKEHLDTGRLFLHKNGNMYVVFKTYTDQGRFICAAYNVTKNDRKSKHRFKLKKIEITQITDIFDFHIDFPEDRLPKEIIMECGDISKQNLQTIHIDIAKNNRDDKIKQDSVREMLKSLPCEDCEHLMECHRKKNSPIKAMLEEFRSLASKVEKIEGGLWISFKRHIRFLQETGFADAAGRLTPDGFWASKLRLDQPLLIAEAIRKGALDGVSSETLAGGLAPFVWDRTQDVNLKAEEGLNLAELEEIFGRIIDYIEPIRKIKDKRGFGNPEILFWPAAALFMWAKGITWEQLLYLVPINDGDMASLIMRTADHLRQVGNLGDTHPQLASIAGDAINLIMREPVYISY